MAADLHAQGERLTMRAAKPDPREAPRKDALALLAHVPAGSLAERVDAARDLVQETLVSEALEKTAGNRTNAAALLGVPDERIADALRRYPWLAKKWPAKRGRPPKRETTYRASAPASPTTTQRAGGPGS